MSKEEILTKITGLHKDQLSQRDTIIPVNQVKLAMEQYANQKSGMKWVRASERLGEFIDSDIPTWKYFYPDFCKVDGKRVNTPHFRKDIETNKISFSYNHYIVGNNEIYSTLDEVDLHRIEWLDELNPSDSDAVEDNQDELWGELLMDVRNCNKWGEPTYDQLKFKYHISKK